MTRSKSVGNHKNGRKKNISKLWKTKRRTKDLDEIHEDMKPQNSMKLLQQEIDFDVPGNAQHYCLHCARYFIDQRSLTEHFKSKVHKRRLKQLSEEPYTQEEAERAAGMGCYTPPKKIAVKTQPVVEEMKT